jgi:sialic acid synthase SpsE
MTSVIAELCQNHGGDIDTVKRMVDEAAACGAQFVKIQSFFADDLNPDWPNYYAEYERLADLQLSWSNHHRFVEHCYNSGIVPMTSVYTDKYLGHLKDIGFNYIKLGSAQAIDGWGLSHKYINAGFKVIGSTGGYDFVRANFHKEASAYLHCVSKYPHSAYESDISRMLSLKYFLHTYIGDGIDVGLSDHSDPRCAATWDMASKLAMSLGASYLERHFMLPGQENMKDSCVSVYPEQLKDLCDFAIADEETRKEQVRDWFGLFYSPKTQSEKDLINTYTKRWK